MNVKDRTILVVDDNEAGRYSISHILRQAGFKVKEAATGAEALEISAQKPDLVVLDINLPDINGLEVCKRIKESPVTATIPVLHLSATFIDTKSRVTGLDSGADGYLVQPVGSDELLATINALLRMKSAEEKAKKAVEEHDRTIKQLKEALLQVKTLSDLLPICMHCKKIRDDQGYWNQIEEYINKYTDTRFSHCICEDCMKNLYPEYWEETKKGKAVDNSGDSVDAK
ncbi:MAG: response regulator transcription factor [Proteobacteria bacterium]|nr:response regulator transcription factor [Pseudomonadota bacterium]